MHDKYITHCLFQTDHKGPFAAKWSYTGQTRFAREQETPWGKENEGITSLHGHLIFVPGKKNPTFSLNSTC